MRGSERRGNGPKHCQPVAWHRNIPRKPDRSQSEEKKRAKVSEITQPFTLRQSHGKLVSGTVRWKCCCAVANTGITSRRHTVFLITPEVLIVTCWILIKIVTWCRVWLKRGAVSAQRCRRPIGRWHNHGARLSHHAGHTISLLSRIWLVHWRITAGKPGH